MDSFTISYISDDLTEGYDFDKDFNEDFNTDFMYECRDDNENNENNNNNPPKRKSDGDINKGKNPIFIIVTPKINRKKKIQDPIDGNDSDSGTGTNTEEENDCPNPLCNHRDSGDPIDMSEYINRKIDIDYLINMGKTFHCKKNKTYFGINLRIMCNLVKPLTKLKNLIGMSKVKENIINQIIFFLQGFNTKDRCNECIDCAYDLPCPQSLNTDMLHTVITGPPGVGKTELGKVLGHVYKAMGVLTKGHFNIATRSDLVGKFLGHTASKTQQFINKCKGGVMFIDEAYSLGNPEGRDSYSKECIDTINQNLTEKRDFLCIIAGYEDSLDKCFFAYNEGLKRRFTFRYDITGYDGEELAYIFLMKVKHNGWITEYDDKPENIHELIKFFNKNIKYFPHFGGDVETLFLNCKITHGKMVLFKDPSIRKILTMVDIKRGFDIYVQNRKYNNKKNNPMDFSKNMMYL